MSLVQKKKTNDRFDALMMVMEYV
uniref:Uncharacterized protein n=1 Tax=Anguilla anguilla TaxID=7936 RepID=A0A0E9UI14_ANGAN